MRRHWRPARFSPHRFSSIASSSCDKSIPGHFYGKAVALVCNDIFSVPLGCFRLETGKSTARDRALLCPRPVWHVPTTMSTKRAKLNAQRKHAESRDRQARYNYRGLFVETQGHQSSTKFAQVGRGMQQAQERQKVSRLQPNWKQCCQPEMRKHVLYSRELRSQEHPNGDQAWARCLQKCVEIQVQHTLTEMHLITSVFPILEKYLDAR